MVRHRSLWFSYILSKGNVLMEIKPSLRKKINKVLAEFSGWRTPREFANLSERLYGEFGMEFLITGYPHHIEPNSKSWNVEYTIDGEEVEDSYLVVSIFEGKYEKDEYTLYVS